MTCWLHRNMGGGSMAVSYNKLWGILEERKMLKTEFDQGCKNQYQCYG